MKGFTLRLILKQRYKGIQKWPIMKQFLNCFVLIPFSLYIFPHIPASWFWPALLNHSPFDSILHSMQTQLPWKYLKQLFTCKHVGRHTGVSSLYTSQVAHQASAYLFFSSMKQLGVFPLPSGWHATPSQGYPQ